MLHFTRTIVYDCPWPGDYVELDVAPDLGEDHVLALQPRTDTPVPKRTKTT